jgi:TorA maturation chaperone TorD
VNTVMRFLVAAAAVTALWGGMAVASPLPAVGLGPARAAAAPDRKDDAIRRAFDEVLRREPTGSELRRYRERMDEDGWTEADIRRDLRNRDEYRTSSRVRPEDVDRIIRRAYREILDREPEAEGLRTYRRAMIDRGWSEEDVRADLRKSPEYREVQRKSAERIVRRAYQDILEREPDAEGLRDYTRRILRDGWSEREVRVALQKSPEYRERNAMTPQKAEQIVRSAYRNVLKRDPDPEGLRTYTGRVLRDKWTQSRVESELRRSDEYRNMKK